MFLLSGNNVMYWCLRLTAFYIDANLLVGELSILSEHVLEGSSGAPTFVTDLFNDFQLGFIQDLGV